MPFLCEYATVISTKKIINDTNTQNKKESLTAENGIPPFDYFSFSHGRASYVTLDGSLTVEASLVMPLFIFAIVSIIQIMIFMNVQLKLQSSLYNQTMKVAGYSFLTESVEQCLPQEISKDDYKAAVSIIENGITEVLVKSMVINDLGDDFFNLPWISGGKNGINIIFSAGAGERNIDVILSYKLKFMYNFLGIGSVNIVARANISKWTGVTRIEKPDDEKKDTENVFVTKNGTVYHIYRDCTYLAVKLTKIKYSDVDDRRNKSGGKYYPCSSCIKNIADMNYVYISQYGECYHADDKCKTIYHNILEVSKDEVSDRKLCSKCRERKTTEKNSANKADNQEGE